MTIVGVPTRSPLDSGAAVARVAMELLEGLSLGQLIDEQQATDKRIALSKDELDGFRRLDCPNQTGQYSEHASLGTTRDQSGRRWLTEQASIAGAILRSMVRSESQKRKLDLRSEARSRTRLASRVTRTCR